jgi:hypothetical protein
MDHGPSCWAGASKLDFDWIQLDWTGLQFKDIPGPDQLRCRSVLSLPSRQASKNEVPEPAAIIT